MENSLKIGGKQKMASRKNSGLLFTIADISLLAFMVMAAIPTLNYTSTNMTAVNLLNATKTIISPSLIPLLLSNLPSILLLAVQPVILILETVVFNTIYLLSLLAGFIFQFVLALIPFLSIIFIPIP